MSLLAVTVGSDPSAVVDAVRAVGWYGVDARHRLACSGGCYDTLFSVAPVDAVDTYCDTCDLRPAVEVSLYSQPGMVDSDVLACVEEGDRRFFKIGDPDVWVTRDGEHLTSEEFARVVQNTTMPVVVNPAEVRWYERP